VLLFLTDHRIAGSLGIQPVFEFLKRTYQQANPSLGLIVMSLEREILDELRKIREAVTPKPTPPPPKGLVAEFKAFMGKAGVLGLAIGFIMGLYINKVVSALVADIIMPVTGAFLPGGDWREATVTAPIGYGMNFAIGDFTGVIIDFLIVAAVVFVIAKYAGKIGLK
jgi:large conductance mechanosensitive channel